MYNRYVPQPDGSYQRNRVQDPCPPPKPPMPPTPPPCEPAPPPCLPPKKPPHKPQPHRHPPKQEPLGSFFKQLLPRELDTADLLIILLLLLMAGDCEEDQNTALLTLVLYLFL